MSEEMTLEAMKGIFITYFNQYGVHLTDFSDSGNKPQRASEFVLPRNIFDVDVNVDMVTFHEYVPQREGSRDGPEDAYVSLKASSRLVKKINPTSLSGMLNSLSTLLPYVGKKSETNDRSTATVSIIEKIDQTNKTLKMIEDILIRIEKINPPGTHEKKDSCSIS